MPISYVLDESYIRVDFFPKRGGMLRIAVPECVTIEAEELAGPDEIWVKFHLHPGGPPATIRRDGQSCTIRYREDKKIVLSGDLPIAPFWNGLEPRELEEFDRFVTEDRTLLHTEERIAI
jgi:hypothetical protein